MRGLARLIMRGPAAAAAVASLLGLGGLLLPPLWLLSGAALGLYTLRRGAVPGAQVLGLASVLSALLFAVAAGGAQTVLVVAAGTWLPAWLLALVLRRWPDQGLMAAAAGALAAAYAVLSRLLVADMTAWWRAQLEPVLELLRERNPQSMLTGVDLDALAGQMQSIAVVSILLSLVASTLLARWWQAALFNPGGFRREFVALRLPRVVLHATSVLAIALLVALLQRANIGLLNELTMIAVLLFAVQGLAVAHALAGGRPGGVAWLVGAYLVFLVMPHLIALLGMVDTFADLRRIGRRRDLGDR